ncbi:MAG: DUF1304 domain-containing protein [Myxococcales bacterium]|nr:DUF1304 domain-containing protein [Myxococcales bacterium]
MVGSALTLLVALLHLVFFAVESFLWTTPAVRRRFGFTAEQAEATKVLAANQGVYNGALAATLVWATLASERNAAIALLAFVVVVGVYGAATAKRTILFVQAMPAAAALVLALLRV